MRVLGHGFFVTGITCGLYFIPSSCLETAQHGLEALLTNSLSDWDKWTPYDSAVCVKFQEI